MRVRELTTPGYAKRAGRAVKQREDWEDVKKLIMLRILLEKFGQNEHLARPLIATGDALLAEGNYWHDNFWGNCTRPCCPEPGLNYLGQLLMAVRLVLRPDGLTPG